jgi:hypothetical protein
MLEGSKSSAGIGAAFAKSFESTAGAPLAAVLVFWVSPGATEVAPGRPERLCVATWPFCFGLRGMNGACSLFWLLHSGALT